MQTSAQNVKSIRFGSGILEVGGVNVGLISGAKFELARNIIKIAADNGKLPVKKKIASVKMSAELYELNLTNLATIDTHGVLTNTTGASTPVTGEVLGAAGVYPANSKVTVANGSSAGIITAVTLKNNGVTITPATNYTLLLEPDGKTSIVFMLQQTITGTGLTIDYTYTSITNKTITRSDVAKLVGYYAINFYNTDENGKKFSIQIPKAYQSASIARTFASDEAVDAVAKCPVDFEAFPDANNVMLKIIDEQA
jgi:hypothetical protein